MNPNPLADRVNALRAAMDRLRSLRPGRSVLLLAGSLSAPGQNGWLREDDLAMLDSLAPAAGTEGVDLVLQAPGGTFEMAEEVLHRLRLFPGEFTAWIPRRARGAASLLGLLADQLQLTPIASLGSPNPTVVVAGRNLPADLVAEAPTSSVDIPWPERQMARASLELVRGWLRAHLTNKGIASQQAEDAARAVTSTENLGMLGRPLRAPELLEAGYPCSELPASDDLAAALRQIDTCLHSLFGAGAHHVVESDQGLHVRTAPAALAGLQPVTSAPQVSPDQTAPVAVFEVRCECGSVSRIQANLDRTSPLQDGHWAFPPDGVFLCPECMQRKDLTSVRQQLEQQTKRKVVA